MGTRSKEKVFSTGPLENQNNPDTLTQVAWVKILNNDENDATNVHIKVFSLNGAKVLVGEARFAVPPVSSMFRTFNVGNTVEYEVQIQLQEEKDDVLISVFGKSANNNLVAAHRALHSELNKIDRLTN